MTLMALNLRPDELRSLYLVHLQQMYSTLEQLIPGLPALAVALFRSEVRLLLLVEAGNTPDQLASLDRIFAELSERPTGPACLPIQALVEHSNKVILEWPFGPERDLLLLGLALEIKHLCIAKYQMALTYARALGFAPHVQTFSNVVHIESSIEYRLRFFLQDIPLAPPGA